MRQYALHDAWNGNVATNFDTRRSRALGRVRESCGEVARSLFRADHTADATPRGPFAWVEQAGVSAFIEHLLRNELSHFTFEEFVTHKHQAWKFDFQNHYQGPRVKSFAYAVVLATLNFGSGYASWLSREQNSTYYTVSNFLAQSFEAERLYDPEVLVSISTPQVARIFRQDIANKYVFRLINEFTQSLNELGVFILEKHQGSFEELFDAFDTNAESIVENLTELDTFNDACMYEPISGKDFPVFFYKKSQLLAADLERLGRATGWWRISNIAQLTLFADNAVAQVLRVIGIIKLDPTLENKIDSSQPLDACSSEEIELRAASINAGQQLKSRLSTRLIDKSILGEELDIVELDYFLWLISHKHIFENEKTRRHLTLGKFY